MKTRTTSKTVTFKKPFVLGHLGEVQPAGDYVVETDEELLQGVSFTAYLKVLILFHLNQVSENPQTRRTVIIAPHELDAALARDRAANERVENKGMLSHVQQTN